MTRPSSLLPALLLGDARTPTGAYAYSSALESAVIAGLRVEQVYPFMLSRLETTGRLDASSTALAARMRAVDADVQQYLCLEHAIAARTPSAAQRTASRALGRGLLRFGRGVLFDDPGVAALHALPEPPTRPVALGVISAALGLSPEAAAEICCYDDLQSIASAALKLLPVDPLQASRWVVEAARSVDAIVAEAREIMRPSELPAFGAPATEHWAEQHTMRTRRLFIA